MSQAPALRITVLVENSAPPALRAEHGLSLWLEYRGACYLLDAGQSGAFAENADRLGIDLTRARLAVLSHGHYDHAGGLAVFCARNAEAPVYCRPEALGRCLHHAGGKPDREIGIPQAVLSACAARFRPVEGVVEAAPGLWLLPHTTPGLTERARRTGMYRAGADGLTPDDFAHEQTAALEMGDGLVLLNSCSHGGMDNVVREAREIRGGGVEAVVDGRRVLAGNARWLRENGVHFEPDGCEGTLVHVAVDGRYAGHIVIADRIKEDAGAAIQALRRAGVRRLVMLTGDKREVAERTARALGLDDVRAELLPDGKVEQLIALGWTGEHNPCPVLEQGGLVYLGSRDGKVARVTAVPPYEVRQEAVGTSAVNRFTPLPDGGVLFTVIDGGIFLFQP